jgi:hypothetical protein
MKNALLTALIILSSATLATAQDYEYTPSRSGSGKLDRMKLGVFIAPNISWMKPTSNKSTDRLYLVSNNGSRVGFTWGLMADFMFSENYGIATGAHVTSTGGNILVTENPNFTRTGSKVVKNADFEYKLQYLEVPLGLKLKSDPIGGSGVKLFGLFGGTLGINIGKKANYEVNYTDTDPAGNIVSKTVSGENEIIRGVLAITPAILQLNVGGGAEFPISPKMSVYTGLYFNNGFVPDVTNPKQYKLDYQGEFTDGNIRLNNFAFRIGLFF